MKIKALLPVPVLFAFSFAALSLAGCDNGATGGDGGVIDGGGGNGTGRTVTVTSKADSGPGSLRQALANSKNGDTITLNLDGDKTINLTSSFTLYIDRAISITIEGNGTVLEHVREGWVSRLLVITNPDASATIRGFHFRYGRCTSGAGGGAIQNSGSLILESCIFSNNRNGGSQGGGAIYSDGTLSVTSCTFYRNETPTNIRGVAIHNAGTLNLGASLFWENNYNETTSSIILYLDIVHNAAGSTFTNRGYNITDQVSGISSIGTIYSGGYTYDDYVTRSGWVFASSDRRITANPFTDSLTFTPNETLLGWIPESVSWIPEKDFYGNPWNYIDGYTQAGAVSQ
ncbi:MAG: hypothetical protein FWH38_10160 [Treponema sp.]|nr:hypothetical protein [Treponema sp.]